MRQRSRRAIQLLNSVPMINPDILTGIEVYPKFEEGESWASHSVDYARYPWSPYHGAWWGANFRGVREFPVDLGEHQSQLVYSPHDYGPEVWKQEWFYLDDSSKTFTRQTLLDDYWYDTWAFLAEEKISPLLMGEWGGWVDDEHDKTGENRHWLQEIRDYMIDMRIHHTFWCFNENSSDTGGLVYDNFQKWDDEKYEFIKPALWQTDDGKFISLDHTIPIGKNGITLTEYYTGEKPPTTTTTTKETTTTVTTTAEPGSTTETTTTTVTEPSTGEDTRVKGDANCDTQVNMADAVFIMQTIANPDKYELTEEGSRNADVDESGDITNKDALAIQKFKLGLTKEL